MEPRLQFLGAFDVNEGLAFPLPLSHLRIILRDGYEQTSWSKLCNQIRSNTSANLQERNSNECFGESSFVNIL